MRDIEIKDLSVSYKYKKEEVEAIKNFSYSFEGGKSYALLGPSGSGKSTLLRAIIGFVDYSGFIFINGFNSADLKISDKNISYVAQDFALYPHMNVFFNIAFPLKNKGYSREKIEELVYDIAEKLEIKHCLLRKPKELSIGQQQRVCIARALIKHPDILLFDEPMSNLDPKTKDKNLQLLKQVIKNTNATTIYVTHSFAEAQFIADTFLIVEDGKLTFSGDAKEVLKYEREIEDEECL